MFFTDIFTTTYRYLTMITAVRNIYIAFAIHRYWFFKQHQTAQCGYNNHKPPILNGLYMSIPPIYGMLGDGLWHCCSHMSHFSMAIGRSLFSQQDESIRVAVLSITAAGTGLTLTVRAAGPAGPGGGLVDAHGGCLQHGFEILGRSWKIFVLRRFSLTHTSTILWYPCTCLYYTCSYIYIYIYIYICGL